MSSPTTRKGRTVLLTSDLCPKANCGGKGHLMSDHVVEKANQCNLCACVAQDVHEIKPGS